MPTTIGSLLVFVALLTPGFVYLTRTETRLPGRRYSALRETATVVSASLTANLSVLAAFWIVRYLWPHGTPDVEALVRTPHTYFQNHPAQITLWSVGFLAVAVGLAAGAAVPPEWCLKLARRIRFWPGPPITRYVENRRSHGPITTESGWGAAFNDKPDHVVYVGLRLRDGTYLDGPLLSYSSQLEENEARSIQLGKPVRVRTPSADEEDVRPWDVDVIIVAASEIKTISINYLHQDTLEAAVRQRHGG